MTPFGDVTQLLQAAREGRPQAANALYKAVYEELRDIARLRLARHRPGQTLNTTALVHEAYLRLIDQEEAAWNDRAHFFATASRAMRFILIDYARRRTADKRGGRQEPVPLSKVQLSNRGESAEERATDLLTLNDALDKLTTFNERLGQLVEYRFFGGLTYEEIAEVTGWSIPTIKRDWRRARTWLYQMMKPTDTPDA